MGAYVHVCHVHTRSKQSALTDVQSAIAGPVNAESLLTHGHVVVTWLSQNSGLSSESPKLDHVTVQSVCTVSKEYFVCQGIFQIMFFFFGDFGDVSSFNSNLRV